MFRRGCVLLLLVLTGLAGAFVAPAVAANNGSGSRSSTTPAKDWTPPAPRAYVVFDQTSGVVLASTNEHQVFLPASAVKLMTALTALTKLPPSATMPISPRAAGVPNMNIGAKPGEVWKLDDMLHALLMISGNDSAYAIAERVGGTVEGFAAVMDATGKELGLRDSAFSDPAGLDGREGLGGGSRMSAYDLAVVARNARAVPQIAEIVRLSRYDFTGPDGAHHLENHNNSFLTKYAGADGMKTGYTKLAQNSLAASATRNGRTLVAVMLGSYGGELGTARWAMTLLDSGFRTLPGAPGTGEILPPVKAYTAEARAGLLNSLARPLGSAGLATAAPAAPRAIASGNGTSRDGLAAPPASGVAVAGERVSAPATTGTGRGTTTRYLLAALIVLLILAVVARRRAVVRRQQRRMRNRRRPAAWDVADP
jgi:D-alanyl-D-alanine carboxypeptidase (penicillin-binding protein 5/6)